MKLKTYLRNVALFSQLNEEELDLIAQVVKERSFEEGEEVVTEGETGDSMFLVYEGEIGISIALTLQLGGEFQSKDKVLTTIDASMFPFFGEGVLLGIGERSATCYAKTDCKVLEITRNDFERIANEYHNVGYRVMEAISKVLFTRLKGANADIRKLTTVLSLVMKKR